MRFAVPTAALVLVISLAACKESAPPVTETVDSREPIGFWYVGAPVLEVRDKAEDTAAVVATYGNGESVSVLAEKGDWVEIRTGLTSGWARKADLVTAEGKKQAEDNPEPKFKIMPAPVSAPSARGEIYIEADVNTDGQVTSYRIMVNSTGNDALAQQNGAALRQAQFYPMTIKGERKPFKYYHRVTY